MVYSTWVAPINEWIWGRVCKYLDVYTKLTMGRLSTQFKRITSKQENWQNISVFLYSKLLLNYRFQEFLTKHKNIVTNLSCTLLHRYG